MAITGVSCRWFKEEKMKQMLMAAAVAAAGFGLSTLSVAAVGDTSTQQATPPAPVRTADRGDSFFALSTVDAETSIDGGSFNLARDPKTYALLLGVVGATLFVVRRRRQG